MVKLQTKKIGTNRQTSFYFHSMKQCNDFIYSMRNHMMNIPWEDPVEADTFPEVEASTRDGYFTRRVLDHYKDKTGKQIAEANLGWADAFCKTAHIGMTPEQQKFVNHIVSAT